MVKRSREEEKGKGGAPWIQKPTEASRRLHSFGGKKREKKKKGKGMALLNPSFPAPIRKKKREERSLRVLLPSALEKGERKGRRKSTITTISWHSRGEGGDPTCRIMSNSFGGDTIIALWLKRRGGKRGWGFFRRRSGGGGGGKSDRKTSSSGYLPHRLLFPSGPKEGGGGGEKKCAPVLLRSPEEGRGGDRVIRDYTGDSKPNYPYFDECLFVPGRRREKKEGRLHVLHFSTVSIGRPKREERRNAVTENEGGRSFPDSISCRRRHGGKGKGGGGGATLSFSCSPVCGRWKGN